MHTLLWFQRDLRIQQNPALNWCLQQANPVIAVYIHSPEEDAPWHNGAATNWWLYQSLKKLADDLLQLNIQLHFYKANSVDKIPQLIRDCDIDTVVWTDRYEPKRIECENLIETLLSSNNIHVKRFKDGLLKTPSTFLTASTNTPYKVFTPFYKKLRAELTYSYPDKNNTTLKKPSTNNFPAPISHSSLDDLELLDEHTWHNKLSNYWIPGEDTALKKLERFVDEQLNDYKTQRDIPSIDGTSSLSPHLQFGEISPEQILTTLAPLIEFHGDNMSDAAETFLRQLIWREFARYILWHFPHTCSQPMNIKYKTSFWKKNNANLKKWQRGQTGIAIVDAGMKQLWETGWMHNRVRMLVASLLTKNMGIPWQDGARWFWDTLIDADLANNSMGWQWVAGCGVDAAPYFRIFNPDTQAKRFDKDNAYINRWSSQHSIENENQPVIDLASSRADALSRYQQHIRNL